MNSLTVFRAIRPGRSLSPLSQRLCRQFSQDAPPKTISNLLEWKPASPVDNIAVNGFVRSVRSMKSQSFVSVGDGSSLDALQAIVPTQLAQGLSVGSAVHLSGSWVASRGRGQSHELQVSTVDVLGPSDASTFPLQKKYQTSEYLRGMPHLRSRLPYNAAMLRLRSEAIASLSQFFASRDFTQTHPPIITSSDCEGGGEAFAVAPAAGEGEDKEPFFRSPKYLTVSTQLHLEALAQSVGDVWSLSPTFRAEKSDTSRHLSEFYMLEAELAFANSLSEVMDLVEDMLRHLGTHMHQTKVVQELLSRSVPGGTDLLPQEDVARRWEGLQTAAWPRLTYTEAIDILSAKSDLFTHKPTWGTGLQSEHEKYLANHVGDGQKPVFVTHYPQKIKAFYMLRSPTDDSSSKGSLEDATVDCFDLLVPEFCEIAGGSMREHRHDQLAAIMESHGLSGPSSVANSNEGKGSLDWYLELRRWGSPPHGGFGLGFDRLLCYLAGVSTVRDMVTFPRWFGRCDC